MSDQTTKKEDVKPAVDPSNPYGIQLIRPTNDLALVTALLCLIFPPAAMITGIIALKQIERTNEPGKGFAITGIIFGAVTIVLAALVIVLIIFSDPSPTPAPLPYYY